MARGKLPAQTPRVPQDTFLSFDLLYRFALQLDEDVRGVEGRRKQNTSSLISTTAQTTDLDFLVPLRPFARIAYRLRLVASPNFAFSLLGPASPLLVQLRRSVITTAGATEQLVTSFAGAGTSSANAAIITLDGVIHNGATEGFVELRWAQNTSSATASSLYAGSDVAHSSIDQ
jgi:hypothetical protein